MRVRMAELTAAKIEEMWMQLTREQRDMMRRFMRLMLMRQEIDAEIAAIQEAADDGRTLSAPTMH
jgi:hypothetical protein